MLTQNMKDVALALRAAPDDTLSKLARQTESYAQNLGMTVLPVTLDFAESVLLDEQLLSAEQAVDAALASGTSLLYLACRTVDSSALTPASGDTSDASVNDLRKALNRIDGWTSQLEIGFAHSGVLHIWCTVTDWFEVLEQLTSPRVPTSARFGGGPTGAWETDQEVESARLSDEAAQDLVDELAANDTFRRAATRGERIDAARAIPALASVLDNPELSWRGRHVVDTAVRQLAELGEQVVRELQPRLPELAAELARDPEFKAIRTADSRHRRAADWIINHTDGLRVPKWWIKELAALAKKPQSGQLSL